MAQWKPEVVVGGRPVDPKMNSFQAVEEYLLSDDLDTLARWAKVDCNWIKSLLEEEEASNGISGIERGACVCVGEIEERRTCHACSSLLWHLEPHCCQM